MLKKYEVPLEQLKEKCAADTFEHDNTLSIPVARELIGQERAMEALKFGLKVKRKGYNIYVAGLTGTGKNSYSYLVAKEFAKKRKIPVDWCYVFNFKNPKSPKAIRLTPGMGRVLKTKVANAVGNIRAEIPKILSSKEYEDTKNMIYSQHQKEAQKTIGELNDIAKDYDFVFKQTDRGILSVPLSDGKPMTDEEIESLSVEKVRKLKEQSEEISRIAFDYVKKIRDLEISLTQNIRELKEEKTRSVISNHIDSLMDIFHQFEEVNNYLNDMKKDMVKNFEKFIVEEEKYLDNIFLPIDRKEDFFKRYEVNLFIDNSETKEAPVIREMNPNYYNLMGKIEYVNELGGLKTDHTKIRPGALHEANGGYLIIQVKDILRSKAAWDGLKRAITTEEIVIENIAGLNIISETLSPEPIPLDIKVIIIGDYITYNLLYQYDADFKKLFKIRADFDVEMERSKENILKIGSFVSYQCKEENLKPFDRTALASIIDLSSRLAENKNRLTARFNELVEIIYEADAWATSKNKDVVTREDVKMAIEKRIYRNNIYEEKIFELIEDGTLLMDTRGYKVGEINGLSVMNIGHYSFGRPNKITVNTFLGKEGILNIEREVEQSGNIYDKGILILAGYLGEKYAKDIQLSVTASITFEQSYDGIEGDSASSTELYALISSLAGLPLNQSIAVTGSVNQKGMIQPIGGVNEKIEGYYKVCKIKGLTGREGVIIPKKNIENLMLYDEVIEDVRDNKFKIYAVDTIDEGIEILTGMKAGTFDENGNFEEGTVNYLVREKLEYYANLIKEYE